MQWSNIEKIEDNATFDEIYRQVRVLRAKDLKDNASRIHTIVWKKQWQNLRNYGVKKQVLQRHRLKKVEKKAKKKDPKTQRNEAMASSGGLKQWMRKNDVWETILVMLKH